MQKNENRLGYKKTKAGWIPEDWGCVALGEVFSERRTRGESSLHVFSVTQDRGLVRRDQVDRRVLSSLTSEECLLVEPGDFAYNMMRMWQGAVDLSTERGVVSPAYVVCRPRITEVFPLFMLRYFKSPIGLYKLWSYSYGLTNDRLRLYFKDFCHVPAPLPPLPEQEAIAGVLECWDKAIRTCEKKVEKKRNIKKGLIQRLLSGKQRLPGFEEEWKEVRLGWCGSFSKGKGIAKVDVARTGLPCIRYGQIYTTDADVATQLPSSISPEMARQSTRIEYNDLLLAGSGETIDEIGKSLAYMGTEEAYAGGDIVIFSAQTNMVRADFLAYYLNTEGRRSVRRLGQGQSVVHVYARDLLNVVISLPSVKEQQAIVAVISDPVAQVEALDRKLVALRGQKRFLLDNLVTGTIRLPQHMSAAQTAIARGDSE